jgi:hypothetical protein
MGVSEGKVLASLCSVQQYISDPAVAEAYGAWQAMEFNFWAYNR